MKISRKDAFDLDLCIRGLGNQLTYMHVDILDYMYHMTLRNGIKVTKEELSNLERSGSCNPNRYQESTDHYIKLCAGVDFKIREYKTKLCAKWEINEVEDLEDDLIIAQAERFSPQLLRFKKCKNYIRVRVSYGKVLTSFVDCLYSYVCAATVHSYKIPSLRTHQFELCDQYDLRFHDDTDDIVRFINTLIDEIMDDVTTYNYNVGRTISRSGGWGGIRF